MIRAIILCAGLGTRLTPITLTKPKPLLQIRGKSILENAITHLHSANIDDIIVVCGYKSELFDELSTRLKFKKVIFPDFATKNSVGSLKFVSDFIIKGTIIINGDLFIDSNFTQYLHFGLSQFLGQEISQGSFWGYITDENNKLLDIDKNANSGFGDGIAFFDNESDLKIIKNSLSKCDDSAYWEECVCGILDKIDFYAFKSPKPFYTEIDSLQDALSANLLSPKEIAMQCATDGKAERLKGITNINYKINFNGAEKVLRIPGANTDKCIDRNAEKRILELIAPLNITPRNDFYENGIKMSDFLSGFRNAEFSDINTSFLRAVVRKMKCLHNIKNGTNIPKITMIGEIQKYENLCKIELTTKWEHKFVMDIARELDSGEFVLCHRDLQLPNIMVCESSENNASLRGSNATEAIYESKMDCHESANADSRNDGTESTRDLRGSILEIKSGFCETSNEIGHKVHRGSELKQSTILAQKTNTHYEIKFVDFEYAGFSPVAWELGNFSAELNLSESQVQTLAQIYGNITPRDIYKGQMLSNYIWALWSWIYNRIDLGRDYLARFDKNLKALA